VTYGRAGSRVRPAARLQGSEIAVTVPDPYGAGQEATQPPPGQGNYPPPPGQGYYPPPPGQGHYPPPPGQAGPPPGFTGAPAAPAAYGYGQYPAVAVPPGMYVDQAPLTSRDYAPAVLLRHQCITVTAAPRPPSRVGLADTT
jgi:hypothetical protein